MVQTNDIPANINMLPENPSATENNGRNFKFIKLNKDERTLQNDTPTSRMFAGIISDSIVDITVSSPIDTMNTIHEQLTIGIQFTISSSTQCCFNTKYSPNTDKPINTPMPATVTKI